MPGAAGGVVIRITANMATRKHVGAICLQARRALYERYSARTAVVTPQQVRQYAYQRREALYNYDRIDNEDTLAHKLRVTVRRYC